MPPTDGPAAGCTPCTATRRTLHLPKVSSATSAHRSDIGSRASHASCIANALLTFLGRAVQLGQEDGNHIPQAAGQLAGHAVLWHAGLPLPCDTHLCVQALVSRLCDREERGPGRWSCPPTVASLCCWACEPSALYTSSSRALSSRELLAGTVLLLHCSRTKEDVSAGPGLQAAEPGGWPTATPGLWHLSGRP